MQTILDILNQAGRWHPGLYLKIDNAPYMELVIEAMDASGPMGLPALSVAHYGELNGDPMRDPEMCFELWPLWWSVPGSLLLAQRLRRRFFPSEASAPRISTRTGQPQQTWLSVSPLTAAAWMKRRSNEPSKATTSPATRVPPSELPTSVEP